jgi:hypothetical protein
MKATDIADTLDDIAEMIRQKGRANPNLFVSATIQLNEESRLAVRTTTTKNVWHMQSGMER